MRQEMQNHQSVGIGTITSGKVVLRPLYKHETDDDTVRVLWNISTRIMPEYIIIIIIQIGQSLATAPLLPQHLVSLHDPNHEKHSNMNSVRHLVQHSLHNLPSWMQTLVDLSQ